PAVLRVRPCRTVLGPRRAGARHLHALAARAQARRRRAARAGERAAVESFTAAGVAHAPARGALSNELRGRAHHCLSRGPRAARPRRPVLRAMLVPRPASPVHAARPLLGPLQTAGHAAPALLPPPQPPPAAP